jgi:hypothetical protein
MFPCLSCFVTCRGLLPEFPFCLPYLPLKHWCEFCCCSMEQLYCKTKCIYLVETTMGVILVTFRFVKLNVIVQHAIFMRPTLLLAWTWRHMRLQMLFHYLSLNHP